MHFKNINITELILNKSINGLYLGNNIIDKNDFIEIAKQDDDIPGIYQFLNKHSSIFLYILDNKILTINYELSYEEYDILFFSINNQIIEISFHTSMLEFTNKLETNNVLWAYYSDELSQVVDEKTNIITIDNVRFLFGCKDYSCLYKIYLTR
jgi:hypothetical protein